MTAVNDEITGRIHVTSLSLVGTGMTATQRLTVTESNAAVIADHYVETTEENVELVNNAQWFDGVKLSVVPAGGTWTVVGRYD
jgi:hypothetical protein